MIAAGVSRLAAYQTGDGAFPSIVTGPAGTYADHNGYTTTRVLRALRDLPGDPRIDRIRSRALAFIEQCRSTTVPGAFGFWPEAARPVWADRLPADIDDTSMMTIELMRYGRLRQHDGLRTVCTVLLRHRLVDRPDAFRPPWIANGAFLTWIGTSGGPNVVDCCVNANAVALISLIRATHLPGYREAIRTILDGLEWAGHDLARLHSLTPFYPSIGDLYEAVEHAIECGADTLAPALDRLEGMAERHNLASRGYCSSAYGTTIWHCPALDEAQRLRHSARDSGTLGRVVELGRYDRARSPSCRTTDTLTSIDRSISRAGGSTTPTEAARSH